MKFLMRTTYLLLAATYVVGCRPHNSQANLNKNSTVKVLNEQQRKNKIVFNSAAIVGGLLTHPQTVVKALQFGQLRYDKPGTQSINVYLAHTEVNGSSAYYLFDENGVFKLVFGNDKIIEKNTAVLRIGIDGHNFQFWGQDYYVEAVRKKAALVALRAKKFGGVMQSFANQTQIMQTNILNVFHNRQTNKQLLDHAQTIAGRYRMIEIEADSIQYLRDPHEISKRLHSSATKLPLVFNEDQELISLIDAHAKQASQQASEVEAQVKKWAFGSIFAVTGYAAAVAAMTELGIGTAAANGVNQIYTGLSNMAAGIASGTMFGFGGGTLALAGGGVTGGGGAALSAATLAAISENVTLAIGLSFAIGIPAVGSTCPYFNGQNPSPNPSGGTEAPKLIQEVVEEGGKVLEQAVKAPTGPASIKLSDALNKMLVLFKP